MASLFRGRGQPHSAQRSNQAATQILPETQWAQEPLPSGIPPKDTVVVTISRQFGSGGAEIGQLVAEEAGLHYVDHEIIDEVARRLGVDVTHAVHQDEQTTGRVRHILEAMQANNPFTTNYGALLDRASTQVPAQELAYLRLTQKVILDLATQGNAVIIGRGAQFLLRSAPRTLHIYIFAPLPYRINNIMQHLQLTHTQAERMIEQRDSEHSRYLHHYYGADGQQPGLYHLLINTGLFSFELAANLIHQAIPVIKEIG